MNVIRGGRNKSQGNEPVHHHFSASVPLPEYNPKVYTDGRKHTSGQAVQ